MSEEQVNGVDADVLCPPIVSRLLEYLGGNPSGDEVAQAVALGALRSLDCYAISIYSACRPAELELRGTFGMTEEVRRRYAVVSTYSPSASVRPFRDRRVYARSVGELGEAFGPGEQRIVRDLLRSPSGSEACMVSMPLVGRGHSIGTLNVCLTRSSALTRDEYSHLDAVAAALSMWLMLHEASRRDEAERPRSLPSAHLRITDRQMTILRLLAAGTTSNKDLSARINFSESTVKNDIQALLVFLDVHDRASAVGRAVELGLLDSSLVPAGGTADSD